MANYYEKKVSHKANSVVYLQRVQKLINENRWCYDTGFISSKYEKEIFVINQLFNQNQQVTKHTSEFIDYCTRKKYDHKAITLETILNSTEPFDYDNNHNKNNSVQSKIIELHYEYLTPRKNKTTIYCKCSIDEIHNWVYVDIHFDFH